MTPLSHCPRFALAGGLLAVAACGVGWPWVTARGLRVSVGYDRERGVEGGEVGAWAEVTNHLPWPAWGLSFGDGVRLPAVTGRSRVRYAWAFAPPARGEYPAGAVRLYSGFPLGVWEAGRAALVASKLVVWPRTFPVGPVPPAEEDAAAEGHSTRGRAGTTGDVVGVRPYRRGDSPRRIHWAQSAKHDRLVVCELQAPVRPAVLVVLDADPAAHTPGPDGSREWAVRVAASLAKGWLDAGARVGLVCGGEVIPVNAGPAQATRVLDALARLGGNSRPLGEVLAAPAVKSAQVAVRVVVASDRGATGVGPAAGVRWAILHADASPATLPVPRRQPAGCRGRGSTCRRSRTWPTGCGTAPRRRRMARDAAGRGARLATFALMSLAYAACEVAAYPDGRPRPFGVAYGVTVLAVAATLSAFVPVPVRGRPFPTQWVLLMVAGAPAQKAEPPRRL